MHRRIRTFTYATAALAISLVPATAAFAAPGNGNGTSQQGGERTTETTSTVERWECEDTPDQPSLHPSGRDRHCEPGGSGTQGKARSEPDADGRGPDRNDRGTDKPGHDGGLYPEDQDGNNGCGNDHDFEDDNEGWCLGPDRERPGNAYGWERRRSEDAGHGSGETRARPRWNAATTTDVQDGEETGSGTSQPAGPRVEAVELDRTDAPEGEAFGIGGALPAVEVEVAGEVFGVGGWDLPLGTTQVRGVSAADLVAEDDGTFGIGGALPADGTEVLGATLGEGHLASTGAGIGLLAALAASGLAGGSALLRRTRG
jgi:hypothetical protein